MKYKNLTITDPHELIYGKAPNVVSTARGLEIGGGKAYPELNLTVPAGTVINRKTLPKLANDYEKAVREALKRAVELHADGIVVEFETLLEMTTDPGIGVEITKRMVDVCEEFKDKHGLASEIRLTPNDTRDFERPPRMRSSSYLDGMFELFDKGAAVGGNLLSIESTGGKEVCDEALTMCQIREVVFALGVLGVRDMQFLWREITEIAAANDRIAGGDTACGFANTAMVLAEMNYIPRTFAAIVRVASAVRSLVAVEEGAIGPDKDCGYEGVYLKAIAGIPISMEGKTAACAHMSPVGNIAAACADLWSNESIQNIKLLGGMAPTVYTEQLIYDCRLMNKATEDSPETAAKMRDLLVASDIAYDPQAFVLAPANVIEIAETIVSSKTHLDATLNACTKALDMIEAATQSGQLMIPDRETIWIERIRQDLEAMPHDESQFVEEMLKELPAGKFLPDEYGL